MVIRTSLTPLIAPIGSEAMDTGTSREPFTERSEVPARVYESIHATQPDDNSPDIEKEDKSIELGSRRYSAVHRGVDVKRAEADFAELSKQLSRTSQHSRALSRSQSRQQHETKDDIEKAASSDESEEPFDLERTLRGAKREDEEAGIKSKRIGVVWDNLTVSGVGGIKNFVKVMLSTTRKCLFANTSRPSPGLLSPSLTSTKPLSIFAVLVRRERNSTS